MSGDGITYLDYCVRAHQQQCGSILTKKFTPETLRQYVSNRPDNYIRPDVSYFSINQEGTGKKKNGPDTSRLNHFHCPVSFLAWEKIAPDVQIPLLLNVHETIAFKSTLIAKSLRSFLWKNFQSQ